MYGLGPQKFLSQAAKQKSGDTSQIQRGKEPGPANHPDTTSENTKMNQSGNEDLENNPDMNMSKAKPGTPKSDPIPEATSEMSKTDPAPDEGAKDTGFFASLKKKVKDYVMKKGTDKMSAMMNPEGGDKSEGSKEANISNDNAPAENRPKLDKPQRPERNDPKPKVPKTPPGPVNNTPTPKIPKAPRMMRPKIPRIR
jgi:hypothetical protein